MRLRFGVLAAQQGRTFGLPIQSSFRHEEKIMKADKKLLVMVLAAIIIVSCTCSLLPIGIDLPQSQRVGSYITVNYPENWYGTTEYDIGVFSPEYVDLEADDEDMDQALMIVFPLEEYFGDDWFGVIDNPEDLLVELADEFDTSMRSITTVEAGEVRWTRGTFSGTFSDFIGTWEGWIAIELLPRGGAIVIATAPSSDWDDVDNIFDAIMKGIDFAD
jgi:hypothetical protein